MSEASHDDSEDHDVYRGAGEGAAAGLLTALLSHWAWGLNVLIMAFVYGFAIARLRGWKELAALLTMIGTTVVYSAIYDIIALDSIGQGLTIGLSLLALALFVVYHFTIAVLVARARARALQDSNAKGHDVERSQHWEESYFAPLRVARAAGRSTALLFLRPIALTALGFVVATWSVWWGSRLVTSVAFGVVFFQVLVSNRMSQYAQRLRQPRGETVVARAERRPILFLRSFALDALLVDPKGDEWYSIFDTLAWLDKRTFEEHLITIFEDLGPVIAIGRPGEEVAPLGAARHYADEASWQALVLDRAAGSELVIMEVDATPGMVWEIEEVSRLVGLQRILIILPPGEYLCERSTEWYERWATLQGRIGFLPNVFKETAAVLYDGDDQPILVAGNKSSVPKTLKAIKSAWLAANRK